MTMKESDWKFLANNLLDMTMKESDWAFLPKNLLDMILDKLVSFSEYVRFGAVCKPWQYVAMDNKLKFIQNKFLGQVPFLMVPSKDNSDKRRSLYSITHNKVYDFQLRVPYTKRLCGSSHGWLFTVEDSLAVTLMNPFSGATIKLPPITEIDPPLPEYDDGTPREVEFEVRRAILSADPASSPNDYIVTIIYSGCNHLAFIRAGDEAWTCIDKKRFLSIEDVIYYKGQIFAIDYQCRVLMIDVNRRDGESKVPQVEVAEHVTRSDFEQIYLVESSNGDLLLVKRFLDEDDVTIEHTTSGFKVFKLLVEQFESLEVKNLGGDTLFVGDNHSICVSASKWPGCRANSIYYTDNYTHIHFKPPSGRRDIGIFNIENGSFGTHYILDPSHNHMPPSIWIVPTVLGNFVQS